MSAATDRNLLFGILALQLDFVGKDVLIQAMHAWVLDKAQSLGGILKEQGALGDDHLQLLEALVQAHLKKHGDNPEQSLATVSSVGSLKDELKRIDDPDLQASLLRVSTARPVEDTGATRATFVGAGAPTSTGTRFRILRPHAKGALGEVFVARDEEIRREVALKQIQEHHADHPGSRARFLIEAEITGGLEHPGIVPVYGLGQYGDGRPYYAMRFIRGDSLQDAIKRFHQAGQQARDPGERTLELRKLLGRFIDVCNAIEYAHSRGVLHRDLKPGNIMLGKYGETLVVDWGLAKLTGQSDPARTDQPPLQPLSGSAVTVAGSTIGTPQYMSPEQAEGRHDLLGPATDVYGLGATLYCLLTGQPPFTGKDIVEVLWKVKLGEFPKPRQVKRDVPAALQAITLKAMQLKGVDRYPSPRQLADDVEHWLADEPVAAYREPVTARLGRWARKHRTAVTAASVALVVAVAGLATATFLLTAANEREEEARRLAETETVNARTALGKAETSHYFHLIALAHREWQVKRIGRARALLAECPSRLRDWEWRYLNRLFQAELATVDTGNALLHVAWSQDGRYLASCGEAGSVKIWDASSRKEIANCRGHTGQVWRVAFSHDGKLLASGGEDKTARLWEVPSGRPVRTFTGHSATVHGLAIHPQHDWLATASGEVIFWDLENGQKIRELPKGPDRMQFIALHPDGQRLAVGGYHPTIDVWDLRTKLMNRVTATERVIYGLAYSPDGRWLASGGADSTVELYDSATGKRVSLLRAAGGMSDIAFSPDSRRLAAASTDQSLALWQVGGGGGSLYLRGHTEPVHGLAFHPDSQQLVSAGQDGALKFWDTRLDPEMTVLPGDAQLESVTFSPDSRLVAACGFSGTVRVWERDSGKLLWSLKGRDLSQAEAVAFSLDGQQLAAGGHNYHSNRLPGVVMVWSLKDGELVHALSTTHGVVASIAFGPKNTLYAGTRTSEGKESEPAPIVSWDLTTSEKGKVFPGHKGATTGLALSPDGQTLVSGGNDHLVRLWDLTSGRELRALDGHQEEIQAVAFHPDGRRVASASQDRTIKLWHVSGELERTLVGHIKGVVCLSFSKDGRRLASGSHDDRVKVWDVATGQDCLSLTRHFHSVYGVAFSPDGTALATASHDRRVLLWLAP